MNFFLQGYRVNFLTNLLQTLKYEISVVDSLSDTSELMRAVRAAQLADQDIQSLIDVLLNKQGGGVASSSTEWNKVFSTGLQGVTVVIIGDA